MRIGSATSGALKGFSSDSPRNSAKRKFIPAVNLLTQREFGRHSGLQIDLLSGNWVVKFQKLRVQEIPSIPGEAGEIFERLTGQAVQGIAYQGMADGCQRE